MRALTGVATVLMLSLAASLQGQTGRNNQHGMRGQGHMMGGSQQMQMGMGSADRVLWLREELGLTEEQVEGLKNTNDAAREIHDGAQLQMRGLQDQLRDGDITRGQFIDLMDTHRDAMMQQQAGFQEQIDAILSDDQKDQLESRRERGTRGRGMRGGRGASGRSSDQRPGGHKGSGSRLNKGG